MKQKQSGVALILRIDDFCHSYRYGGTYFDGSAA